VPLADWLRELHDPRVRVIRHPRNRGLARARNTGLAAARAPLVAQLDADDMWEPDYLASVIPRFEDQGVGLVYTNATILGHPTGHDDYIGDPSVHPLDEFPKLAEACPIPSPTATMRTGAVRAVGGYAWWLRQCEDYHLYLKLAQAGWRFDYVHRRLARYRWPEPRRGMSYDSRRHELWELAMFGSIVARHPRTPGPRRQVRIRTRREAERVRAIAGRGLPAPTAAPSAAAHPGAAAPARPARILVDPGSHAVMNLGDIAMLQVCVERLRRLVPGAAIEVITADPERLARHCPGVAPVPAEGVYPWFDSRWSGGPYSPLLSQRTRDRLVSASRVAGGAGARAARAALRAELLAREPVSDETRAFLASLLAADAVVVSGRGGTADAFLDDGLRVLELLRLAAGLGAVTAMLGQGLGPAEDPGLAASAADVLPRLDLIAVRDRLASLPLLERAGVAADRIAVTGDDALAPAHAARPAAPGAAGIGVGLRMAGYAEVGEEAHDAVGRALRAAAERHGTDLRGIPISLYPHEADADVLERIGAPAGAVETPADAIARAGECRVVVAGSYHAAVFALAQGVPVVGLASSAYYAAKLNGLADLFPGGCTVVPLAGDGLEDRIAITLDDAWAAADSARPALLEAAERQIGAAEAAYERLAAMLTGAVPARAQNGANGSASGSRGPRDGVLLGR
jgi:colanic acid/amylovoran biosynthesis protein